MHGSYKQLQVDRFADLYDFIISSLDLISI